MALQNRLRLGAVAVVAVVTLSCPGAAEAGEPVQTTEVAVAQVVETDAGYEITIAPGQTLPLEPEAESIDAYIIEEGEESTLPAGWSVLTNSDGLRITAPSTAADGEFAVVEAVRADGTTEEVRVVVEREDVLPQPTPSSSADSSSWVSGLLGKVATFFGS
ncbi:hypothetical protein M3D57_09685 [Corynebacterium sanguinis]|uniref:hypothetical protein n=1 Tax=Corynebacterium sanguinis TaxID=2594913 RepID=UPI00223B0A40|nr:hypothetical protein [Corynebacterium sanguinis]MCT1555535.1 hypothetical protein [Corynebacterium sanguinis]MCT1584872.1 hypothetical protein [Corynebacterium sanguinis]MCT1614116.1 hypothetical protein [Corynebacterium sanguinis]MCT1664032.1 hypothetical protein [Corynebacterium sanguinis]MCT1882915.1 hypothetical protein [Corynebacterium sanguinis]